MSAKEIWEELNKKYGTYMEMFEDMEEDLADFSMDDVRYEMAMGSSFDDAMQRSMKF